MREDVWVSVSGFSDADPDPVRDCCAGIFLRTGSADCVRYEQKDEEGAGTAVLLLSVLIGADVLLILPLLKRGIEKWRA